MARRLARVAPGGGSPVTSAAVAGRLDPRLRDRFLAGAGLALLAVGEILLGGWFFALLLVAVVALIGREWTRLGGARDGAARDLLLAASVGLPAAAILLAMVASPQAALLLLALGSVAAAGMAGLLPGASVHRAAFGALYIGIPAVSLLWLRHATPNGIALVLWLFFVVWATDTCAYFAGRAIGGPRLAPRLSPSKTWAGLGGGVVGAAAVGAGFVGAMGGDALAAAPLSGVLAVVAQAGDLFESWLKRRVDVKDSGSLIPGHGGVLDRLDGLLFAAPVFAGMVMAGRSATLP